LEPTQGDFLAAARDDGVKQAIATKIIDLAKAGERSPDFCANRHIEDVQAASVGTRTWR
jgi:hypothetical protein